MPDFLRVTAAEFRSLKSLADRALAQVGDAGFFTTLDGESNSLALIVKHVAGNLRSRWTDFLTSDGEKPDRNRDGEFERAPTDTRESVMKAWEAGWERCLDTLESLRLKDLDTKITIRNDPLTAETAIQRSLAHTAQHVGQIVFLSKHFAGSGWKTLSIPRKRP
jgi:hypothetical protein